MSNSEEKNQNRQNIADRVKGKQNEAAGKAQTQVGKTTGNREQEIRSKAREASSQTQSKTHEAERDLDR